LKARVNRDRIEVSVAVSNIGARAADETVQLYVGFPGVAAERPKKLLRGFKRETLQPDETKIVRMTVPLDTLRWWNPQTRDWQLEHGIHAIFVGSSSRDSDLLRTTVFL
jgi:beta-glucosidase